MTSALLGCHPEKEQIKRPKSQKHLFLSISLSPSIPQHLSLPLSLPSTFFLSVTQQFSTSPSLSFSISLSTCPSLSSSSPFLSLFLSRSPYPSLPLSLSPLPNRSQQTGLDPGTLDVGPPMPFCLSPPSPSLRLYISPSLSPHQAAQGLILIQE